MAAAEDFRALHRDAAPLLMPNAWDVGSAKLLASLGFRALATTSSGSAAALGQTDGALDRDTALAHGAELAAAVAVPVSADLENGFADDPAGVAATIERAAASGLAGASVEDWSGSAIYERELAVARVAAAVQAAAGRLVITARAENLIRGVDDLADTLARLQAFAAAGADVVFAPGLRGADQIRAAVDAVEVPLSVLTGHGVPPVAQLGELGVSRVSVGGRFAFAAYGALVQAAQQLREGSDGFLALSDLGRDACAAAMASLHV